MAEHIVPTRIYLLICATLLALTFLTWRVALVDLGPWNVVLALTIAFSKATLVALFFMHVRYSPRRTQLVVVAGIFWLGMMILLTMSDYLTRQTVGTLPAVPNPPLWYSKCWLLF